MSYEHTVHHNLGPAFPSVFISLRHTLRLLDFIKNLLDVPFAKDVQLDDFWWADTSQTRADGFPTVDIENIQNLGP